jgi:extracellular elastinolytic metalloproteinase
MYWDLRILKGFSDKWKDVITVSPSLHKGNIIAMQLVMGGLKYQPCNPTFTQARDAILLANDKYYNGVYRCLIWKSFAKRGLGFDSVQNGFKNGFKVPVGC